MAAYTAVVSLQRTIDRILESYRYQDSSRIELVGPSREIIQLAYRELEPLQEALKRLDDISPSRSRKKVNALDGRIKEAVWRFEDLLESHISHQILSQFESSEDERVVFIFSIDLQSLQGEVDSFIEMVKDMEKKYIYELNNMPLVEEDEYVSSRYDFGGMKAKMVGFSDEVQIAKNDLVREASGNYAYSFVGMPGSGKTTVAENVFEDPTVLRWFDHRAWVTVGRKYQFSEIAQAILAQLDPNTNKTEGGDNIGEHLKEKLKGKRSLIVLDDVWDTQLLDYFTSCLPLEDNAVIRILLTTNLQNVARHITSSIDSACTQTMRPLNQKESEDLLREKVFGGQDFPHQLEKAAKKIAKNCKGHPLMIITVAALLSKANKNDDPDFWDEVAENRKSVVMMDAYNQISKVLFPVYDCFPQSVKMFYLYLGAFPQDSEIPVSKLMSLLTAERFLEVGTMSDFRYGKKEGHFGSINTIVISEEKTVDYWQAKTCRLNSSWWHLFNKEASTDKFLHVLNNGGDGHGLEQTIKGQRRLCLHSNFVFNFKQVYNSVKSDCASTARSLLCFGPYHQYSTPLDAGFKLLRVLDALKVRFYTFPIEILQLVLLQYLALTCNGEIPSSISKLFNLEFLIIHPHMSIKYSGAPPHVPVQIWDMKYLQHIEILGSNLPIPERRVSLHYLETLLGVDANSSNVVRKSNIRKLGIQIELTPKYGGSKPLIRWFSPSIELKRLQTLKCTVVNPHDQVKYRRVAYLDPIWMMQSKLRKLHLSGTGYPWKYMETIGSLLESLQALKLRNYAFQGPTWETKGESFMCLVYLVIEDTDLEEWKPSPESFPELRKLKLKYCYKLKELHWPSASRSGRIEMVDCNPLAVTCAKKFKQTAKDYDLQVIASFEDEEIDQVISQLG